MATLDTGDLTIPEQIFNPWVKKIHDNSAIMSLSPSTPMKFGKGEAFVFDIGEAEYVGEGANKGGSTITSTTQTIEPFKFHKTVRWTEEVQWADEDHQLGVVQEVLNLIQPSLSRALDFGVIHGFNPNTGTAVAAMTQRLVNTTNSHTYVPANAPYAAFDAANALVMAAGGVPNGVALDPELAATVSGARTDQGLKIYPDFSFGAGTSVLEGLNAATSRTVGAVDVAAAATNLLGVVGDFSAVRWGIQKSIGLEVIRYGDPDGGGDLKRNNQIAFRAEVVYGWGIAELNRNFAKIVKSAV